MSKCWQRSPETLLLLLHTAHNTLEKRGWKQQIETLFLKNKDFATSMFDFFHGQKNRKHKNKTLENTGTSSAAAAVCEISNSVRNIPSVRSSVPTLSVLKEHAMPTCLRRMHGGCIAMTTTAAASAIVVWGRPSSGSSSGILSILARSNLLLLRIETALLLHGSDQTTAAALLLRYYQERERDFFALGNEGRQLNFLPARLQLREPRLQQATPIRGAWSATRPCPSARCTTQPTCPTNSFRGCSDLGSLTGA